MYNCEIRLIDPEYTQRNWYVWVRACVCETDRIVYLFFVGLKIDDIFISILFSIIIMDPKS